MSMVDRLRALSTRISSGLSLPQSAIHGAATAIYLLVATIVTFYFAAYYVQDFTLQKLPAYVLQTTAVFAAGAVALLIVVVIARLPAPIRYALVVFAPFILLSFAPGDEPEKLVFTGVLLVLVALTGGGIGVLYRAGFRFRAHKAAAAALCAGVAGLLGGAYAIFHDKGPANPLLEDYRLDDRTLDLPNPGLAGAYTVRTLTYGSGRDLRREEYGAGADLLARSVDGSKLIENWDGFSGWLRTRYWGFDATELPLQARVWYPDGDGPFPLVLIVHGNHSMEDFSDPGYDWLGEHLASRGIILASVDENFINSSMSARVEVFAERPGLKEENDARGWLLLQHLAQWRDWNREPGHRFAGRVDMDRVALFGHSRGGEAVAVAAAFNDLDRYPDDASLEFDFGFNLRGVIAIAPVDGQYEPRDSGKPIRDVNYFTIHGDMDGDVQSFEGTAQYARVSFSGDAFRFRSSLYVQGANHGQFNTTWENLDMSIYRAWVLDLDDIMDGEAQRNVARVYFTAFLEIVLNDREEYLPIFRDARYAAGWLPDTFYINRYDSTEQHALADFEEDIDPSTASVPGGRISAQNLSRWYEVRNTLKYDVLDTHSAVFAWDDAYSSDTGRVDFSIAQQYSVAGPGDVLVAAISTADIDTLPDGFEPVGDAPQDAGDEESAPIDFTIEVRDADGDVARLPLSHDDVLYPQVRTRSRHAWFLDPEPPSEALFRGFELPLADFIVQNPAFDPATLAGIGLVFDRSRKGAIMLDDLSIRTDRRGDDP